MRISFLLIVVFLTKGLSLFANNDSLLALLPKTQGLEKAVLLNDLAIENWNVSPDKGIEFANEAYAISLEEGNKGYMAKSLQNIGICYWAKSEYYTSLDYYQKSLIIYEEIEDRKGIASLSSCIGLIYDNLSNYDKALAFYLKALEIGEEEGYSDIYAKTLGNTSLVYLALKNYDKALDLILQAIDLCEKNGDLTFLPALLNTQGTIYEEKKDYENARLNFKKALERNRNSGDKYGITISLYNIGSVEYLLKNYEIAMDYFLQSQKLSEEIDDKLGVLLANKSLGLIYQTQKKYRLALNYFEKSHVLAVALNSDDERLDVYQGYAKLYIAMGNAKQSDYYFDRYINLKDSIYSKESSGKIAEMQTKYESEKKEKENELLRKNNEIQSLEIETQTQLRNSFIAISVFVILLIIILFSRFKLKKESNLRLSQKNDLIEQQKIQLVGKNEMLSEQYEEVNVLNAMKDKFFRIISHDLKGPFNSILGLTDLLNTEYDAYNNDERKGMIAGIDTSANHAYELLINLLTWAQAQTGEIKIVKEKLDLKELVENCISLYGQSASLKHIDIVSNIPEDVILAVDKDTSLIFIGNLINNAIKFTPTGGLISIEVDDNDEFISIHIQDTGIGMPPEVLKKLFRIDETVSTVGTNNEKGTGLGLILCREFVEKNGGSITVHSEVSKGSEFVISFPKAHNN